MTQAVADVLSSAALRPSAVDLIIYCGVGRGFLEPANAAFIGHYLGISCECFDVSEACMSWSRALQIAYGFLRSGTYTTILIVNGEFSAFERALPQALRLRARQALRYSLGALTVGEGTTATLLVRSQSNWAFRFRSRPALAPLCTLPLPGFQDFSPADPHLGLNGELQLTAFSNLLSQGAHEITALVRELYTDLSTISLWVPHAPSELHPRRAAQALGVQAQTFSGVFRKFGNLVSASIPASLASAQKEGRLRRGDRVVLCPVSAGLSFGVIDFVY